jgi:hypothetical protein
LDTLLIKKFGQIARSGRTPWSGTSSEVVRGHCKLHDFQVKFSVVELIQPVRRHGIEALADLGGSKGLIL